VIDGSKNLRRRALWEYCLRETVPLRGNVALGENKESTIVSFKGGKREERGGRLPFKSVRNRGGVLGGG